MTSTRSAAEAGRRIRVLRRTPHRRPAHFRSSRPALCECASMPDSTCIDNRRDVLERAFARGLHQLGARARDGVGADDGDAALQRVGRAIQRLAIAVRGRLADASIWPELSPMSESMSCATSPRDPRASRPRRCRVTSPAGSGLRMTSRSCRSTVCALPPVSQPFERCRCRIRRAARP